MGLSTILTTSLLALRLFSLSAAAPAPEPQPLPQADAPSAAASEWWFANIERQGVAAYGAADHKVFRNVMDYGARGDGTTDDTEAINAAITDGNRCGFGCDSSTNTPALVYFPPGTYLVSRPIIPYYYTHMVGDLINPPTLRAAPIFQGMAVIDANPYDDQGNNWFTNQNNFFRQVRNFKIDLTGLPMTTGTGIHWQVAQATSLQNIEFNMVEDKSDANVQQGIFMENGSGGFMTDLTFNGGKFGMWVGNQQFTTRNLRFNNCRTAIFMNWNWVWTFHGISINNCDIGIDMTAGGESGIQTAGSLLVLDSTIANTPVGVATLYNPEQSGTNGTIILDNVDMSQNVPVAVRNGGTQADLLTGNAVISWVQGRAYNGADGGNAVQQARDAVAKPAALLDDNGRVVARSKPQYADIPASRFVSVKSRGAVGDGETDDTAAIQAVFDSIGADEVVYFDHGAYVITDTVRVPANVKVVGEIWPLIMAGGNTNFQDQANPKPVWQVGQPGDVGNIEMQDLMFETRGPQPGAILMEFNVEGQTKGSAALFDVHFRVGGSAGTLLQSDRCSKTPEVPTSVNPECIGSFMLMHVTKEASIYMENNWLWVSDHELDRDDFNQINIYNGRGILIESTKGAWLWGTASEHNTLVNYQISNAANVYMALIQTETAYYQGNPDSLVPFSPNAAYFDPDFSECDGSSTCHRTWGMRIHDSEDIFLFGGGLYSFFNNYDQVCVGLNNCQDHMINIENSSAHLYGVSTKAAVNMVRLNGQIAATDSDNRNNFCAAIASFES
ncbi:family 55 glycoside hydrolase [Stachybotrys elegans]|uniref:Family 55 glycoside hydrolase n=1 Tax=Stachybotrys elegans TaxID=80388 RepID=A0A8K0WZ05_9HYPO|nr:family 55 glycoside hydrolase [Stachybotrys elegans]